MTGKGCAASGVAKGMRARVKFLFQVIIAVITAFGAALLAGCARSVSCPGFKGDFRPGCLVCSDCGICDCRHVQCGQLDGWTGWVGWADLGDGFCRLWWDRLAARADLPGRFCFHRGRCDLRFFVVQRPSRPACSWAIRVRCSLGATLAVVALMIGTVDLAADHCHHPDQRSFECHVAGRLFQVQPEGGACSRWRLCTIISNSRVGVRRRSCSVSG